MENKSNDNTPLRPEGNRVLNGTIVDMNLNEMVLQVKNETTWKNSDRNAITIFKSEALTIVLVGLKEHAALKPHHSNGAITVQVLEGKINFQADQKTILIEKGQMIALKEKIEHSVVAIEDSFFLLTKVNQPI